MMVNASTVAALRRRRVSFVHDSQKAQIPQGELKRLQPRESLTLAARIASHYLDDEDDDSEWEDEDSNEEHHEDEEHDSDEEHNEDEDFDLNAEQRVESDIDTSELHTDTAHNTASLSGLIVPPSTGDDLLEREVTPASSDNLPRTVQKLYQYGPLPGGYFRVLRLHAGSPESPLVADLITAPVLQKRYTPYYEALSYTWGDSSPTNSIVIPSAGVIRIRSNLRTALGRLRYPDKSRYALQKSDIPR
jgi:hypothetical protein